MKRLRHGFPLLVALAAAFLSSPGSGRETPHLGRIIDLSETPMVDGVGPIGASLDTMPFYHEGTWHLFHLQNGMAIAHRTSKDLVHWKIEPIALWQGEPGEADSSNIATGTVIQHEGKFYCFYTGNQNVCLAASDDLFVWKKSEKNPILVGDNVHASPGNFRDPYVFYNDQEKCWWLLVCTQAPGDFPQRSGCVGLAKSKNLLDWQLADPLWKWNSAMHADCPQVFQEGDFWYLFTLDRNSRYRIADSPFGPWRRPPRRDLMLTPLFAMSRPASDGNRWVTFPFICGRHGEDDFADLINAEVLAIPRQLDFHKDGSVTERVIPELIEAILAKPALEGPILAAAKPLTGDWTVGASDAASKAAGTCNLLHLPGMPESFYLEMDVTLDRKAMDAVVFFRAEPNLSAAYQIDLQPEEGLIVFRPCNDWDNRQVLVSRAHPLPVGRPFKVRLFVSGTVMEVFIDDVLSLCHRVYAHSRGDLFLETRDGKGTFSNIKIRKLLGDVKL